MPVLVGSSKSELVRMIQLFRTQVFFIMEASPLRIMH